MDCEHNLVPAGRGFYYCTKCTGRFALDLVGEPVRHDRLTDQEDRLVEHGIAIQEMRKMIGEMGGQTGRTFDRVAELAAMVAALGHRVEALEYLNRRLADVLVQDEQ